MDFLGAWFQSVAAAVLLGGVVLAVCPDGAAKQPVRLGAALLMALCIFRPLTGDFRLPTLNLPSVSAQIAEQKQSLLADEVSRRTAAHIEQKAREHGLVVTAAVTCATTSEDAFFPLPAAVTVTCDRPLHAQNVLRDLITKDLNIPHPIFREATSS